MTKDPFYSVSERFSVRPKFLSGPVPSDEDYLDAVKCALAAPDHGQLHPARFIVIENKMLLADFFKNGALANGGSEEDAERAKSKALKAPAIVAAIVKIDPNREKIPVYEQWMTAGAAVTNFLQALEAKGFGGIIVSGASTRYPQAVEVFCKKDECISCWIMLGTPNKETPVPQPRDKVDQYLSYFP